MSVQEHAEKGNPLGHVTTTSRWNTTLFLERKFFFELLQDFTVIISTLSKKIVLLQCQLPIADPFL